MADDIVRITGDILRVDHREGTNATTGKPWSFDTAVVMVGGLGLASVDVPDDHKDTLVPGTQIDIACTLSVYNNRSTLRPLAAFPKAA